MSTSGEKKTKIGRVAMVVNIVTILVIVLIALMLFTSLATQRGHSLLGIRSYIVLSDSMSPAIPTGSYIIVQEKHAKDIQIGDVISFYMSDGVTVLTHRVVEKIEKDGAISFVTQGDANNTPDGHPVESSRVLGTMLLALSGVGSFLLSLRQPFSLIICIFILVVIFLAPEVYRYFKKGAQPKERPEESEQHNTITWDETLSAEAFPITEPPMAANASLPIGRAKRRAGKSKNAAEGEVPPADTEPQAHEGIETPLTEDTSREYDEAIIIGEPLAYEAAEGFKKAGEGEKTKGVGESKNTKESGEVALTETEDIPTIDETRTANQAPIHEAAEESLTIAPTEQAPAIEAPLKVGRAKRRTTAKTTKAKGTAAEEKLIIAKEPPAAAPEEKAPATEESPAATPVEQTPATEEPLEVGRAKRRTTTKATKAKGTVAEEKIITAEESATSEEPLIVGRAKRKTTAKAKRVAPKETKEVKTEVKTEVKEEAPAEIPSAPPELFNTAEPLEIKEPPKKRGRPRKNPVETSVENFPHAAGGRRIVLPHGDKTNEGNSYEGESCFHTNDFVSARGNSFAPIAEMGAKIEEREEPPVETPVKVPVEAKEDRAAEIPSAPPAFPDTTESPEIKEPPRKRGRPRKNPAEAKIEEKEEPPVEVSVEVPVEAKEDRAAEIPSAPPAFSDTIEAPEIKAPPKKRGRPRKNPAETRGIKEAEDE